ncbi:HD-GYP domain-containing protein [Anoxybacillus ayderensis]|uniref:HD-GYP domain-containing protein n=1 Tax=Anoxybacillus ayderensis TaxID=265546 RepID=UPI002E21ED11|nr:HD domain-containing protein [Anoxybacillus ayderensis]
MDVYAHAKRTIMIGVVCCYTFIACVLACINISKFFYIASVWFITIILFLGLFFKKEQELQSLKNKENDSHIYQYVYSLRRFPTKIIHIVFFCFMCFFVLLFFIQLRSMHLLLSACLYGMFHSILFYVINRSLLKVIEYDVDYFFHLGYRSAIIASDFPHTSTFKRFIHYGVGGVSLSIMYVLTIHRMFIQNNPNEHVVFFIISIAFLAFFLIFYLAVSYAVSEHIKTTIYTLRERAMREEIPNVYTDEFSILTHTLNIYNDPTKKALRLLAKIENKSAEHKYIADHSRRVAYYCLQIGQLVGLQDRQLNSLYQAALLHDIGKIGIPDYILLKKGALSKDEFSFIQQYPNISHFLAETVFQIEDKDILTAILFHKECLDGTGYPNQLIDKHIPIMAKIISIADAFDALMSTRPYRRKKSRDEAIHILKSGSGIKWDEHILNKFINLFTKKEINIIN